VPDGVVGPHRWRQFLSDCYGPSKAVGSSNYIEIGRSSNWLGTDRCTSLNVGVSTRGRSRCHGSGEAVGRGTCNRAIKKPGDLGWQRIANCGRSHRAIGVPPENLGAAAAMPNGTRRFVPRFGHASSYRREVAPTASGQCDLRTVFPKVISGLRRPIAIQAAISLNMNLPE